MLLPAGAGRLRHRPDLGELASTTGHWYEGQRNTTMVSSHRHRVVRWCRRPTPAWLVGAVDLIVGAARAPGHRRQPRLEARRRHLQDPEDQTERTSIAVHYVTTWGNGDRTRWHVLVTVSSGQRTMLFDAWYQTAPATL
ncbi:MAG: hypothetical protein HS111_30960 [Kofleriaceae bacterium]|nr:hypothetical protein [Kofleriaceae bacterium]